MADSIEESDPGKWVVTEGSLKDKTAKEKEEILSSQKAYLEKIAEKRLALEAVHKKVMAVQSTLQQKSTEMDKAIEKHNALSRVLEERVSQASAIASTSGDTTTEKVSVSVSSPIAPDVPSPPPAPPLAPIVPGVPNAPPLDPSPPTVSVASPAPGTPAKGRSDPLSDDERKHLAAIRKGSALKHVGPIKKKEESTENVPSAQGLAKMLAQKSGADKLTQKIQEHAGKIKQESQALDKMVQEVLAFDPGLASDLNKPLEDAEKIKQEHSNLIAQGLAQNQRLGELDRLHPAPKEESVSQAASPTQESTTSTVAAPPTAPSLPPTAPPLPPTAPAIGPSLAQAAPPSSKKGGSGDLLEELQLKAGKLKKPKPRDESSKQDDSSNATPSEKQMAAFRKLQGYSGEDEDEEEEDEEEFVEDWEKETQEEIEAREKREKEAEVQLVLETLKAGLSEKASGESIRENLQRKHTKHQEVLKAQSEKMSELEKSLKTMSETPSSVSPLTTSEEAAKTESEQEQPTAGDAAKPEKELEKTQTEEAQTQSDVETPKKETEVPESVTTTSSGESASSSEAEQPAQTTGSEHSVPLVDLSGTAEMRVLLDELTGTAVMRETPKDELEQAQTEQVQPKSRVKAKDAFEPESPEDLPTPPVEDSQQPSSDSVEQASPIDQQEAVTTASLGALNEVTASASSASPSTEERDPPPYPEHEEEEQQDQDFSPPPPPQEGEQYKEDEDPLPPPDFSPEEEEARKKEERRQRRRAEKAKASTSSPSKRKPVIQPPLVPGKQNSAVVQPTPTTDELERDPELPPPPPGHVDYRPGSTDVSDAGSPTVTSTEAAGQVQSESGAETPKVEATTESSEVSASSTGAGQAQGSSISSAGDKQPQDSVISPSPGVGQEDDVPPPPSPEETESPIVLKAKDFIFGLFGKRELIAENLIKRIKEIPSETPIIFDSELDSLVRNGEYLEDLFDPSREIAEKAELLGMQHRWTVSEKLTQSASPPTTEAEQAVSSNSQKVNKDDVPPPPSITPEQEAERKQQKARKKARRKREGDDSPTPLTLEEFMVPPPPGGGLSSFDDVGFIAHVKALGSVLEIPCEKGLKEKVKVHLDELNMEWGLDEDFRRGNLQDILNKLKEVEPARKSRVRRDSQDEPPPPPPSSLLSSEEESWEALERRESREGGEGMGQSQTEAQSPDMSEITLLEGRKFRARNGDELVLQSLKDVIGNLNPEDASKIVVDDELDTLVSLHLIYRESYVAAQRNKGVDTSLTDFEWKLKDWQKKWKIVETQVKEMGVEYVSHGDPSSGAAPASPQGKKKPPPVPSTSTQPPISRQRGAGLPLSPTAGSVSPIPTQGGPPPLPPMSSRASRPPTGAPMAPSTPTQVLGASNLTLEGLKDSITKRGARAKLTAGEIDTQNRELKLTTTGNEPKEFIAKEAGNGVNVSSSATLAENDYYSIAFEMMKAAPPGAEFKIGANLDPVQKIAVKQALCKALVEIHKTTPEAQRPKIVENGQSLSQVEIQKEGGGKFEASTPKAKGGLARLGAKAAARAKAARQGGDNTVKGKPNEGDAAFGVSSRPVVGGGMQAMFKTRTEKPADKPLLHGNKPETSRTRTPGGGSKK